jgi:hypothetical protein
MSGQIRVGPQNKREKGHPDKPESNPSPTPLHISSRDSHHDSNQEQDPTEKLLDIVHSGRDV